MCNMGPIAVVKFKHVLPVIAILLTNRPAKVHSQNFLPYINTTLSKMCPYSSFCHQGPVLDVQDRSMAPCCIPCSCQPQCISRGNCCPDFVVPSLRSVTASVNCKLPVHVTDKAWLNQTPLFAYYYIKDTCLPGYGDQDTIQKCMNPQANLTRDVINVATVSDGEMIYSNRHCAKCNKVTTFSTWNPILYDFKFDEQSSKLGILPTDHVLYFVPADAEQTQRSRCYLPGKVIDRCNVTGDQNFYDADLAKACEKWTMFYKEERFGREQIYKNPFCFLCNKRNGMEPSHQCTSDDLLLNMADKSTVRSGFATLLDLKLIRNVIPVHNQADTCRQDEIYDQHYNKCRRLHCPIFSAPVKGQCISTQQGVQGFTISTVFELDTDYNVTWDSVESGTLMKILRKLLNVIGLEKRRCTQCTNKLFTLKRGNHTSAYIHIDQQTTAACSVETVLEAFRKISQNPIHISIKIQDSAIVVNSRLSYDFLRSDFAFGFPGYVYKYINSKPYICRSVYVLNDKFCAYIEITEQEFNSLDQKPDSSTFLTNFRRIENDNVVAPVYRICIDDYKQNYRKSSANIPMISTAILLCPLLQYI